MAQQRRINYSDKDFHSLKQELITYAKSYFPDTYNDFSPTSPGMMFMEQAAYVGDLMSFYQDIQTQETFLQYAQEKSNLYNLAYMMGYRPNTTKLASVDLDIFQRVPAKKVGNRYEPDLDYAMVVDANLVVKSNAQDGSRFFINTPVDFTIDNYNSKREVTVYSSQGGVIEEFLLKKKAKAYAGNIREQQFSIGVAERFHTITLQKPGEEIAGILSVTDQDGNIWYEVPYLGQDTIFVEKTNSNTDKNDVAYVLELQEVPRRFVTRYNTNGDLVLQFGSGTSQEDDKTFIPNPSKVGDSFYSGSSFIDVAYDPTNMLFSDGYGTAPNNTTLTIKYVTGQGVVNNVESGRLTNIETRSIYFSNPSILNQTFWESTLAVTNPKAAQGGKDGDTPEEIRQNAMSAFNAQKRMVTRSDFSVRALSMPAKFGGVAKAYTAQEQLKSFNDTTDSILDSNPLALSLYVLSYDASGKLVQTTSTLKQNLQTYLSEYKMLSDGINIRDAFVVNIGVEYEIITLPEYNSREVLQRTQVAVTEFFDTARWTINQPIELSKLYTAIDRVKGVQSAENIRITNKVGGVYSDVAYDVNTARRRNIVYPSYDPMIFEVKFPDTDIIGRVTYY